MPVLRARCDQIQATRAVCLLKRLNIYLNLSMLARLLSLRADMDGCWINCSGGRTWQEIVVANKKVHPCIKSNRVRNC